MCHMSRVTYHMSHDQFFFFFLLDKVVKLVGGGSVIKRATESSFTIMLGLESAKIG